MGENVVKKNGKTVLFWSMVGAIVLIPIIYFSVKNHYDRINVISSENFERVFNELKEYDDLNYVSKVEEKDNLLRSLDDIIVKYSNTVSASRALFYKGYVCYFAGDYGQAKTFFEKFLVKNAKSYLAAKANYFLSYTMYELGDSEAALKFLDAITDRLKDDYYTPLAFIRKGELYEETGEKEKALGCYQEVVDKYSLSSQSEVAKQRLSLIANDSSF